MTIANLFQRNLNAVDIDVSIRKSTAPSVGPALRSHAQSAINTLLQQIINLGGNAKTCMVHYQKRCKRKGHNFSSSKVERIYQISSDLIAVFPQDESIKNALKAGYIMSI